MNGNVDSPDLLAPPYDRLLSAVIENPKFQEELRSAVELVYLRYPQSTYLSSEDLQQEVLTRFGEWLSHYRSEVKTKALFIRIARNLLIETARREGSSQRDDPESSRWASFDEFSSLVFLDSSFLASLDVKDVLTGEQFEKLASNNPDFRLELTADGELIIMPPTGSRTGLRNARITEALSTWARNDGTGLCFDSSTGFALPNGARRSPDASWIKRERWATLSESEQEGFAPICPDFVLELRSTTDALRTLQEKMVEYIENGASLAWLIDAVNRNVHVYRPDATVEILQDPELVSGEPELHGFMLDVSELWSL
jgi:Uma2 family endonuclease